uniref:Homeobox domain-containing protein n=1 Tax=Strongyloides stercoralis TaxID=6248 RepID=A0A0K0DXG9_STRER
MNQWFSNMRHRFMNTFVFKKEENDPSIKIELRKNQKSLTKKNEILGERQYNSDPSTNPGLAAALNKVSKIPNNYYSVPKNMIINRCVAKNVSNDGENSQFNGRPRSRTTLSEKANILENNIVVNKKKPRFAYGKQIITSRKLRASSNKPKFVKCRSLDSSNMISVKKSDLDFL